MLMVVRPAAEARATSCGGESRPSDAVVCRCKSINRWMSLPRRSGAPRRRAPSGGVTASLNLGARLMALPAMALDERAILANQQLEVLALFLGEFQKHLLALGILESR